MSRLKKLFKWCPTPKDPISKTLKRYAIPTTILISVSIVLFSFLMLFPGAPTQQTILPPPLPTVTGEYDPGVSVGDYVTYGNFVCNVVHQGEGWVCANDLAFKKVEVIEVSGKEVTFHHTQQYKNGSATPINGCTETWNVEQAMWSDETADWINYCLIIATNLTEGCSIHSHNCSFPEHVIAKTQIRTYLGVSGNVNLIITNNMVEEPVYNDGEYVYFARRPDCNITDIKVYDLETGFLLELEQSNSNGDVISAMSVVETNIFSTPTSSLQEDTAQSIPTEALYVTTGLVGIVIFGVTMAIFRKRRLRGGENNKE